MNRYVRYASISNHFLQSGNKIVRADEKSVETFTKNLKFGASYFRYYNSRPFSCIHTHLVTLLVIDQFENPIAYGHLEKEAEVLWLGIAVADDHVNKGLGKLMMKQLIDFAAGKKEPTITLSVDEDNLTAQKLYKNFGFIKAGGFRDRYIFELRLT